MEANNHKCILSEDFVDLGGLSTILCTVKMNPISGTYLLSRYCVICMSQQCASIYVLNRPWQLWWRAFLASLSPRTPHCAPRTWLGFSIYGFLLAGSHFLTDGDTSIMRTSNFASSHHGHDSVAIHRWSLPNRDATVLDQILLIKLVLGTPVSSNPEDNEQDELSTRRFLLRLVLTVSAVVTSAPSKATATPYCQPIRPTKNRHQLPWPCRFE